MIYLNGIPFRHKIVCLNPYVISISNPSGYTSKFYAILQYSKEHVGTSKDITINLKPRDYGDVSQ